jgi:NAD(P)-dependent dehydrogenase (short-subunit alcohol dehydrogenase family)
VIAVFADATVDDQVQAAVDAVERRFGALYGLVNNAARGMQDFGPVQVGPRKKFYETPPALWRDVIHTNVRALLQCLGAARGGRRGQSRKLGQRGLCPDVKGDARAHIGATCRAQSIKTHLQASAYY